MSKKTPSGAVELLASDINPSGGIYCPHPKANMQAWNTHPKVFLNMTSPQGAHCPYCGAQYVLKAGEHLAQTH